MIVLAISIGLSIGLLTWFYTKRNKYNVSPTVTFKEAKELPVQPRDFLIKAQKRYGDHFTVNALLYKFRFYVGSGAALKIYRDYEEYLDFDRGANMLIGPVLGGIKFFNCSNEIYKSRNIAIISSIRKGKNMIQEQLIDELDEIFKGWCEKEIINIVYEAQTTVARINLRAFVGKENVAKYVDMIRDDYLAIEESGFSMISLLFPWLPFGDPAKTKRLYIKLTNAFRDIVQKRLNYPHDQPSDLLDLILINSKSIPSDQHMDYVITILHIMFMAGNASTVSTYIWMILHLIDSPIHKDKLIEKLVEIRNNDIDSRMPIQLQDILECKYIDHCIKESMRTKFLYTRPTLVLKDFKIDNYDYPAGSLLCISTLMHNLDPTIFTDPYKFNPDRWENGNLPYNTDLLFGYGAHRCRGEFFALQGLKTAFSMLFLNYNLSFHDNNPSFPECEWPGNSLSPVPKNSKFLIRITPK